MALVENEVEEVVVEEVFISEVEVRFIVFSQKPSILEGNLNKISLPLHRHSPYISWFYCICNIPFLSI